MSKFIKDMLGNSLPLDSTLTLLGYLKRFINDSNIKLISSLLAAAKMTINNKLEEKSAPLLPIKGLEHWLIKCTDLLSQDTKKLFASYAHIFTKTRWHCYVLQ